MGLMSKDFLCDKLTHLGGTSTYTLTSECPFPAPVIQIWADTKAQEPTYLVVQKVLHCTIIQQVHHTVAYLQVGVCHIMMYHGPNLIGKWTSGVFRVFESHQIWN